MATTKAKKRATTKSSTQVPMQPASEDIWDKKYRLKDKHGHPVDDSIEATYERVARALADVEEPDKRDYWFGRFAWALQQGAIPAGRITSNAGAFEHKPATSTINCTVSGTVPDSMDGILSSVHNAGLTLKAGCGIGYEFSTLRPKGAYVSGAGAYTSGPMSFMDIFDSMCLTVSSAGGRRGAQMGTFDISHPDIMDFILSKRASGRLRQFNLSCLITKDFMEAVIADADWDLVFPASKADMNDWSEDAKPIKWRSMPHMADNDHYTFNKKGQVAVCVYKSVKARRLWDVIMGSTYDNAEPGFILIDRVNQMNNNWFCEDVRATNPCVTGDTMVLATIDGGKPTGEYIKVLVEKFEAGHAITVQAYNHETGKPGFYPVTWAGKTREKAEVVRLKAGADQLVLTPDHKVWSQTRHDYVEASKLHESTRPDVTSDHVLKSSPSLGLEMTMQCNDLHIEQIAERHDVYDITVDEVHNFFANDILIHNCGEQPLPPYGACLLGSVNLTKFVLDPFTDNARFDWESYREVVGVFTRMLDNVVEINGLPLSKQREEIMSKRRHGMGFLGLGSTLTMLRTPYGSPESLEFTDRIAYEMARTGFKAGLELAEEKGMAPALKEEYEITPTMMAKRPEMAKDGIKVGDKVKGHILWARYSRYLQQFGGTDDPEDAAMLEALAEKGCRFTHHSSIAPTGTISLSLANNASNGIEPSFAHHYARNIIREGKKSKEKVDVFSFELLAYREFINSKAMPFSDDVETRLPNYFISADDVTPKQHVDVQAAAQTWVDSSISKTANVPTDFPYGDFKDIYLYAYEKGLKGCTTFRFNPEVHQGVLVKEQDLANTTYRFKLEDGTTIEAKGNDEIEYDGETHTAANLYDALHDGFYGRLS